MILYNRDGKIIAVLKKGVLIKKVDSRIHKLRIVDGYGIDKIAYERAMKEGISKIRVVESDTGKELEVSVPLFEEKCLTMNLGYGPQFVLAGSYWEVKMKGQERLI